VTRFRLIAESAADHDVVAAFDWYEGEKPGLGSEFLDELAVTYERIQDGPLRYEDLRGGIRRALLRRFPYAVYFAVERDLVVVVAVLHGTRDPAEWQRRRG
jgi:toxin ParE1/3/4